ncbi:DNA-directed RNA polymerase subunit B [Candidatus Woesearchaeota archaeon]|nr:DNA-directed RNA polymerase subunit B [Candidatus Woesearchaeota archaeon]
MATEVFLNGKYVGTVDNHRDFLDSLKTERRRGAISNNVNVQYEEHLDRIHVETTRGRTRRPLIVVQDGKSLITDEIIQQLQKGELTWNNLVEKGIIEYLDAAEEENALVAFYERELTPSHTHLEVSPLAMFGLVTSMVPYGNFSQSARLLIGAKNQKYGIGLYTANYLHRLDMDVNILHYPQMPIVQSLTHGISRNEKHPAGQNVVVAVMSYKGYNIEDAIIINKGSVDFGFARSTYFRPAVAEELRYSGGLTDQVSVPDKEVKGYKSERDYRHLEDDGIVYPEAVVGPEDVIIGKTSPPRFLSSLDEYSLAGNIRRESSVGLKHGENGVVDFVVLTENGEGNKLVQVRLRDQRLPEIGDKFTSRAGQKGIVGLIVPEADLPFTSNGMTPDIIFSPHSIPGRMTVSHLLEMLGGKTGALGARKVDATSFSPEPEERIRQELLSLGFREDGTETLYNGQTGERIQAKIYVGSMYYLKLRHLVANRIQSRARGPIQLLTRQPTEGRAKEGGLRLGEMEKDTLVAHGASLLLKERFDSDQTLVPVCESCGVIAIHDSVKNKRHCPICGEGVEVSDIEISYAFKLILDEFKSLGLYPKMILESKY